MHLSVREETSKIDFHQDDNDYYCLYKEDYVTQKLLYTPPTLNIMFLPCPPGFTLLGDPPGCECDPVLTSRNFQCRVVDRKGHIIWSDSSWLGIEF